MSTSQSNSNHSQCAQPKKKLPKPMQRMSDKGLLVDKILHAFKDENERIIFIVRWVGSDKCDLVYADDANEL